LLLVVPLAIPCPFDKTERALNLAVGASLPPPPQALNIVSKPITNDSFSFRNT
jgi:hypothetical protein